MDNAEIKPGKYRIENVGFDSSTGPPGFKAVLSCFGGGSPAGTPIVVEFGPEEPDKNWLVQGNSKDGYTFRVSNSGRPINMFVYPVRSDAPVTGMPFQTTTFNISPAGPEVFRITCEGHDGPFCALQATPGAGDQVVMGSPSPDTHQQWRFVSVE